MKVFSVYDATFAIRANFDMSPLQACRVRYQSIKRNTFDLLEEEFLRETMLRIDATSIDDTALCAVREQWGLHKRRAAFDWEGGIMPILRKSHPRSLDMALWCRDVLCGLAVARLSDSKEWLSLTYLEGNPDPEHPLKNRVLPAVIAAMDMFACQVQLHDKQRRRPRLRVMRPLPEVLDRYRQLGYSDIQSGKGDGKRFVYVVTG